MNRDTHHRRDRRAVAHPRQVAPAHRVAARPTTWWVAVHHHQAVLEAEEVRGAGAPEAGLVAVQAVAREAAQVAVLEAEADYLGQNRITTSSKSRNAPMT